MKNTLKFTVCIPTYYGGESLVQTVKTLRRSKKVEEFPIIVSVDGNPLKPSIRKALLNLEVCIIDNKVRRGQVTRIKQMIGLVKSEIIILTQDDVVFKEETLFEIINAFIKDAKVTMVGANVIAAPAMSFFESVVEIGVNLTHSIGRMWRAGDNYLLSSGRCLAFRTKTLKRIVIPPELINSDAYLYFANKYMKGKFRNIERAIVYNKSPQTLSEQLKQSRKFVISKSEISKYTSFDLSGEYSVPLYVVFRAVAGEFLARPMKTFLYCIVCFYTRTQHRQMYAQQKRFWDTDLSTKKVILNV